MSDTIGLHGHVYTESIPVNREKPVNGVRFLKIVIYLLLLFLAGNIVYYLFILPLTSPAKVHFSGAASLSDVELKKIAGLKGSEKWGELDTKTISRRLASYPLIAEAKVSKSYPDKISIGILERTPVAVLYADVGNRTVALEIDKTGTVFRIAPRESYMVLPVISGLAFENPRTGMTVHKQLVPLFNQLEALQKKNSLLLSEISEIRIEQKKYGGFDLLLYPIQMRTKVRTDGALNEELLQYMMLMLDVVRKSNLRDKITEVDVRAGTVAYRMKGEINE